MASKPRWRRRKEERPGEIVAAALAAFAARGYAKTRLEDVARRAGVSKGTLYLYFPSKEELFKAVVRQTLLPNLALAEQRLAAPGGTTDAFLSDLLHALGRLLVGTPLAAIPKLIISEAGSFPELARFYTEEVAARGVRLFAALIARGAARGELRAFDAKLMMPVLMAPVLVLALWKSSLEPHAGWTVDTERFLDTYVDVMLNGLKAPKET